ncbi:MAG: hypothetical protein JG780_194 [Thermosipho sp. (in: Bacteria)]|jgi:hypothetical protein|nr:hypothetical protein [Thermosipho sp. (in: thermotogales)]
MHSFSNIEENIAGLDLIILFLFGKKAILASVSLLF